MLSKFLLTGHFLYSDNDRLPAEIPIEEVFIPGIEDFNMPSPDASDDENEESDERDDLEGSLPSEVFIYLVTF